MHIDMNALRALEREKDISFDVVVEAIEAALLSAYHKTPGAHAHARVELDKHGEVRVWARERLDEETDEEERDQDQDQGGEPRQHPPQQGIERAGARRPLE